MNYYTIITALITFVIIGTGYWLYRHNQYSTAAPDVYAVGTIYLPSSIASIQTFRAISSINNTELAWDVHEVLVEKDIVAIGKTLWRYRASIAAYMFSFLLETISLPITWQWGKTHIVLYQTWKLWRAHATGEAYEHLLRTYDPSLGDMVVTCINNQRPITGIKAIIQNINNRGYMQRIASNIGITHYPLLVAQYPDMFSHFNAGTVTQFDTKDGIKKPDARFFKKHITTYAKQSPYFFIFIDNNQGNVIAAARNGMIGILVDHITQLRTDLKLLGILE